MKISGNSYVSNRLSYLMVDLSNKTKTPHLGSCLSISHILTSLYFDVLNQPDLTGNHPERDRFFLSKGHASPAHYLALALRGYFPLEEVFKLSQNGSIYEEHCGVDAPNGIEFINGSLGHALGVASGVAIANKLNGINAHNYVLMGDGESNEGTVWEAAIFAVAQKLNRLTVIIDNNNWQATDRSEVLFGGAKLRDIWESFGWHAIDIDGHDYDVLSSELNRAKESDRPTAIIAHTIKGKGISFMEDDNNWHYRIPTEEEVQQAKKELLPNA